ncbi:hypothetical protein MTO96_040448 [Rhipicephalus appendiculatus]
MRRLVFGTPCARPVALCGDHRTCKDDAAVPHCRRQPTRRSHHEHLRRGFLQDWDNQVIMLPGACVRQSGTSGRRLRKHWVTKRAVPRIDICIERHGCCFANG